METAGPATATDKHADAPDWKSIGRDILCPLCEYNLRGLIDPRCPECGHGFVWQELLEQREHQHPYLFEHHPRHKVWSLLRTLRGSMRPRRFWRDLQPVHRPAPMRLVAYWLVSALIVSLLLAPAVLSPVYRYYRHRAEQRKAFSEMMQNPAMVQWATQQFGSVQAYANRYFAPAPALPLHRVIRQQIAKQWWLKRAVVPAVLAWLAWPWLTTAALLLYRASMRQARIKPVHVVRCAIYTADAGLLLGPVLFTLQALSDPWGRISFVPNPAWSHLIPIDMLLALSVLLLLFTYRLWVAYARYLRFPHAFAAVAASQVIVALALLKGLFMWTGH